jgi:hypothetical protein
VILGLKELEKSRLSRKALLVVSDGGENNSRYNHRELEKIVEDSDVLIYAIGFKSDEANFPLLKWMAELSGGLAISRRLHPVSGRFASLCRTVGGQPMRTKKETSTVCRRNKQAERLANQ